MRNLILIITFNVLSLFPVTITGGTGVNFTLPNTIEILISNPLKRFTRMDLVAFAVMQKESLGGLILETEASKKEGSVGPMQIQKGMVDYINEKCHKSYTLMDRLSIEKSIEMFKDFQSIHNPTQDIDLAAHIWNAGQNRVTERWHLTEGYRAEVRKFLKTRYNFID